MRDHSGRHTAEAVHEVAGHVVPISLLHELRVDEDHLHKLVQEICEHVNLTEDAAAHLIAHVVDEEMRGGAKHPMHTLIAAAAKKFGRAPRRRPHRAHAARHVAHEAAMEPEGGFSFSDFLKKASGAVSAAKRILPAATGIAEGLGLNRLASIGRTASQYAEHIPSFGGAALGGAALGGAARSRAQGFDRRARGGAILGGAILPDSEAVSGGMGRIGLARRMTGGATRARRASYGRFIN